MPFAVRNPISSPPCHRLEAVTTLLSWLWPALWQTNADPPGNSELGFSLGRKVVTNLDSILKSTDITLPTKVRLVKAMVFPVVMYGCESWTVKKAECRKLDGFELSCWRRLLESPLGCKEIHPVHPKGGQSWVFIGRTDAEAETLILWPLHAKSWLIGKDPDAGRDWGQEKGTTEDEMAGWHHRLDGTWVWVKSGSWWSTGRPGELWFMGSQRVGHDWWLKVFSAHSISWTKDLENCARVAIFGHVHPEKQIWSAWQEKNKAGPGEMQTEPKAAEGGRRGRPGASAGKTEGRKERASSLAFGRFSVPPEVWPQPASTRGIWDGHLVSSCELSFSYALVGGSEGKESACNVGDWVGQIPWRRECPPTPVFMPGEFHGQRSPVGYSPRVAKSQTWLRLTLYWKLSWGGVRDLRSENFTDACELFHLGLWPLSTC